MTIKPLQKVLAAFVLGLSMMGANAASIGFDQDLYIANPGDTLTVTINYDFTDLATFGGGMNLVYDTAVLQFVSFEQTQWTGAGFPQNGTPSLVGTENDGEYTNFGIGTFDFAGISTAGTIGVFTFSVIGANGDAGCGATMCLTPVTTNPFGSTTGGNITDQVFNDPNSITAATVVPVPAAVWFMLSGLGALFGFGRRKA